MKVISIRRKQFLGGYMSQRAEVVPEWVGLLAGASVTIIGPTLIYCAVSFQLLPLYVMACVVALGVMAGGIMFRRGGNDLLLCIPMTGVPRVRRLTLGGSVKKVA
jgi:hypothetical protein